MKLKFIVDPNYVLVHSLTVMDGFSSDTHKADIIALQNYAWNLSSRNYDVMVNRAFYEREIVQGAELGGYWSGMDEYIKNLKLSNEFGQILGQVEEYKHFCEKEWHEKDRQTSTIIEELTGFNLKKSYSVYLSHPSLLNGISYGGGKIGWGHYEDWPNYTVVYLWHEILHTYFDDTDLSHALIQLISDEEMRIRLNGGEYPPFVGHEDLASLTEKVLPYWKAYLREKNKDILQFKDKLEKLQIVK